MSFGNLTLEFVSFQNVPLHNVPLRSKVLSVYLFLYVVYDCFIMVLLAIIFSVLFLG